MAWNGDVSGGGRVKFPFFRKKLLVSNCIVPSWQMIMFALCFLAVVRKVLLAGCHLTLGVGKAPCGGKRHLELLLQTVLGFE